MRFLLLLLAAALLLPAALLAQTYTVVSPAAFTTKNGSGNYIPFSYSIVRYQQIHTDLPPKVAVITGLAWRRYATTKSFTAFSADVQCDISTAATPATAPSLTFAANHGFDLTAMVYGAGGPTTFLTVNWPYGPSLPWRPCCSPHLLV